MGSVATCDFLDGESFGDSAPAPLTAIPAPNAGGVRATVGPELSAHETQVLEALSRQHRLTFGQLLRVTYLEGEELRVALGGLHMKGLIARLQTVIETYCRHHTGPGGA